MVEKTISNPDNKKALRMKLPDFMQQFAPKDIVEGGGKTKDKLFFMSWEEAPNYFTKKSNSNEICSILKPMLKHLEPYNMSDVAIAYDNLIAFPTAYAKKRNVYCPEEKEGAWWWFRSPGNTNQMASATMNGQILYRVGSEVDDPTFGVRPLCWVKKDFFLSDEEKKQIEENALKQKAEEERKQMIKLQEERRKNGLCPYCGGAFKGFFKKVCSKCGKNKDY